MLFLHWLHLISSFFLELALHWSPVAPADLGSFSFSALFIAFSYCSWGSQGNNTEVVCHSLLQWTTFCQTSPPWPVYLGWPHTAWLNFIELDKLWSMWSDWLVVCDCSFSLPAIWCLLSTPTILFGFLLPCTWGISSLLLQQSIAAAPYLGHGVVPLSRCPWAWTWQSSCQLPPRTWTWGNSSQPLLCCCTYSKLC